MILELDSERGGSDIKCIELEFLVSILGPSISVSFCGAALTLKAQFIFALLAHFKSYDGAKAPHAVILKKTKEIIIITPGLLQRNMPTRIRFILGGYI